MTAQPLPTANATLWSRLATTPLCDVLRGRLTGSLDMRGVIAAAALPKPLNDLIRLVARRTRLWRIERVEVARELTEHFRDGLAAGRTAEELVESFGDPRQSARLIRRARLRCRPLFWRVWRRTVQVLGSVAALVVGCYLFLAIRLWAHHPTLAHNYGLELIAPTQGVPEADRAWPFYRQALLRLTPEPVTVDTSNSPAAQGSVNAGGEKPGDVLELEAQPGAALMPVNIEAERPGDHDWPKVERWLDANREALDLARQGGARPRFGFVYADPANDAWLTKEKIEPKSMDPKNNEMLISFLLPQYQEVRRLRYLIEADARRALEAEDRKAFLSDVGAMVGMAEQIRDDLAILVVDLISFMTFERALALVDEALSRHSDMLDEEDLAHLAHQIASYAGGGTIVPRLTGERAALGDFLQRMYSDDGHGSGVLTHEGLTLLENFGGFKLIQLPAEHLFELAVLLPLTGGTLPRREVADRAEALFDRAEAEFQRPLWQWTDDNYEAEVNRLKGSAIDRIRYAPLLVYMPGMSGCYAFGQFISQERDATLVALALTLFHRRHGAWPERLDELVPDLLPAVPADRFTGEPIRYRLVDGQPLVYSVGPDKTDNGGQLPKVPANELQDIYRGSVHRAAALTKSDIGWDWVLWPREPEPDKSESAAP